MDAGRSSGADKAFIVQKTITLRVSETHADTLTHADTVPSVFNSRSLFLSWFLLCMSHTVSDWFSLLIMNVIPLIAFDDFHSHSSVMDTLLLLCVRRQGVKQIQKHV